MNPIKEINKLKADKIDSISFTGVRKYLQEYVKSLPEYEEKWKDFFEAGAGVTMTDIAAGVTTFLAFNAYMNRKDSLLDYSALPTTVNSISTTLGYKPNRRTSPEIEITLDSPKQIYWKKEEPIARIGSKPLSLLRDHWLKAGVNVIKVVSGHWDKLEMTIQDSKDYLNVQVEGNVDNLHYHLFLNETEVETTLNVEDMNEDNILLRTHNSGLFIIFGNGTHGRRASIGDELKFEFIVPGLKLLNTKLTENDISLDVEGEITKVKVLNPGSDPDSVDKMVALAPGYHSTRRMLRSYGDYNYIGASYEGMISCQARPKSNSCCAREVVYLRNDELKLTPYQREEFEKHLNAHAEFGIEHFILDPKKIHVDVRLKIVVEDLADRDAIEKAFKEHYQKMCRKLGGTFSPGSIYTIKDFDDVKSVYIQYPLQDNQAGFGKYFSLRRFEIEWIPLGTFSMDQLSAGTDLEIGYEEYPDQ